MNYLLSTGQITNQVEYYIIDLFKLYLNIWPKDIPGASKIGFNFIFTNKNKREIYKNTRYKNCFTRPNR